MPPFSFRKSWNCIWCRLLLPFTEQHAKNIISHIWRNTEINYANHQTICNILSASKIIKIRQIPVYTNAHITYVHTHDSSTSIESECYWHLFITNLRLISPQGVLITRWFPANQSMRILWINCTWDEPECPLDIGESSSRQFPQHTRVRTYFDTVKSNRPYIEYCRLIW